MPRFAKSLETVLIDSKFEVSNRSVFAIANQILDILERIHTCGMVYNDIKPSNLMFVPCKKILTSLEKDDSMNDQEIVFIDFSCTTRYVD